MVNHIAQARNPRPPIDQPGLGLHNEHVYKYWRWQGWINKQVKNLWSAFLCYDFASREHYNQKKPEYTPKNRRVD